MKRSHLVAIFLYPPASAFDLGCAASVFGAAPPGIGGDWYSFAAGSINPGPVATDNGTDLHANHGLEVLALADTIIVPSWDPSRPPQIELSMTLKSALQRGTRLVAAGSGIFLLAAVGALEGRRVAAHWSHAEELVRRHPSLSVEPNAIYLDDGQIVTGAGAASSIDMFLHIVCQDFGIRQSNLLARSLIMPPHRDGHQAQLIQRPVPQTGDTRLHKVLEHMRSNATKQQRTEALAAMAGMSPTNFNKRFRKIVGHSPYDWLIRERVAIARELLEESALSIDQVGVESGFGSTQSFRAAFTKLVGMPPAAYRRGLAFSRSGDRPTVPAPLHAGLSSFG